MNQIQSVAGVKKAAKKACGSSPRSGPRMACPLPSEDLSSLLSAHSPAMRELTRKLERVIDSEVTIAIFGESGTGKELVARALHAYGPRRSGPFVAINCAAIADSLQDSELFGHERGAFTGAQQQRPGCFEQANGGTLFLDELGEMSASTQARLLRTLEQRTVRRVGGTADVPVDVRIVCATRRDLREEMHAGRFREDLFFRLVVYPLELPPLRERRADIPTLVAGVLGRLAESAGRGEARVHPEALAALERYDWPGNVRELINVLQSSLLLCHGDEIALADLPPYVGGAPRAASSRSERPVTPLRELERSAIEQALASARGHVGEAAKLLGISRATLYRRVAHWGISPARAPR
jgi:DNA-binding NtrC family response regulator